MERRRIGILGYDGVTAINLVGPLEAFANSFALDQGGQEIACYEPVIIGCGSDQFSADSGVTFRAKFSTNDDLTLDTLIVPGGRGLLCEKTSNRVAEWVKANAERTRRIASVCTGIYGLAPTGLLDGRRVTTHWQFAPEVATRFPKLRLEESAIVLKDGKFYTAAGATAGIDLALTLIAEDFGQETAVRVARKLLVYFSRDGGQEQYAEPAALDVSVLPQTGELNTARMEKLVRWIDKHLGEDLRLDVLAKRALLSKNEFIQQFTARFGVPPGLFIKNLRFNEARRRLMSGRNATEIARSLGFADPAYFIQEFRRRFGALPDDYQRRFGSSPAPANLETEDVVDELRELRPTTKRLEGYRRPRITSFTTGVRRQSCVSGS
ncbi:MAG: hypothetical protein QOG67_3287 [Verrucomicrobiota bacterium]|jgi:transcriptional regulator GlxA family with amidase domain